MRNERTATEDAGGPPAEVEGGPVGLTWSKDKKGNFHLQRTYSNVLRILTAANSPLRLRKNLFQSAPEVEAGADWAPLTDQHLRDLREYMGTVYRAEFQVDTLHQAALGAAERRPVHPVRDYLRGLEWDGEKRAHRLLGDYFHCAPTYELNEVYSTRFLVGAVARIMQPGCKLDTMLIVKGAQGAMKSTAFAALCGGDWFSDQVIADLKHANASQAIEGVWFFEFGELESMRKAEATAIKAWLSRSVEHYRAPYARTFTRSPRQCICVGTTNEATYSTDSTGSRRLWGREVIPGKVCDVAAITRDRDQIWAESVALYDSGVQWWLTADEDKEREISAEDYRSADPWEDVLSGRSISGMSSAQIMRDILEIEPARQTPWDRKRVSQALQSLGYTRGRERRTDGTRCVVWHKGAK